MKRKYNNTRTVSQQVYGPLLRFAKEMRKNPTQTEKILWAILRNRQLGNLKFRRQHPFTDTFIIDFYCAEQKVAIELDGEIHSTEHQWEYDENRTTMMNEYGIHTIRFSNSEVLSSPTSVREKILAEIDAIRGL